MNIVRNSGRFFDLKDRFHHGLEKIEKSVYNLNQDLQDLHNVLELMLEASEKNRAYYFIKRVSRLIRIYQSFLEKKGYDQREFNRLFHVLAKISKDDRVEFLQDSIKNRIEKIASDFTRTAGDKHELSFLTFSFRSVHFMIKNYPGKLVKETKNTLDYILVDGKKLDIFPSYYFGVTDPEDRTIFPGKLLILKTENGLKCLRFDDFGPVYNLSEGNLQKSLRNLPEKIGQISQYIKRKGIRYYLISK